MLNARSLSLLRRRLTDRARESTFLLPLLGVQAHSLAPHFVRSTSTQLLLSLALLDESGWLEMLRVPMLITILDATVTHDHECAHRYSPVETERH